MEKDPREPVKRAQRMLDAAIEELSQVDWFVFGHDPVQVIMAGIIQNRIHQLSELWLKDYVHKLRKGNLHSCEQAGQGWTHLKKGGDDGRSD